MGIEPNGRPRRIARRRDRLASFLLWQEIQDIRRLDREHRLGLRVVGCHAHQVPPDFIGTQWILAMRALENGAQNLAAHSGIPAGIESPHRDVRADSIGDESRNLVRQIRRL